MQPRWSLLHAFQLHVRSLVPSVRVTQVRLLACFVLGVVWSGRITLAGVAASLPLGANPASTERRLQRWLANPAVEVAALWSPVRRALLAGYRDQELTLVLDPTPLRGWGSLLCLGVVQHRRVLPLAWQLLPLRAPWPASLPTVLAPMLAGIAADLPSGCRVTLLADRGFDGPGLLACARTYAWDLVLRLRAGPGESTWVRLPDGTAIRLVELLRGPGQHWHGPVALFKKAGWVSGWLTIHWPRRYAEPWVLFSTRPGGAERVREYRRRRLIEATFQDLKRRGFGLEQSRLGRAERVERLVLVVVLAFWWLHGLGGRLIRTGQRCLLDRTDRRDRSRLQLGWAWLQVLEERHRFPPLLCRRTPTGWVYRWAR
jgi:hypothetical protein